MHIVVTGSVDHKTISRVEPFHFPSEEDAWLYAHGKFYSSMDIVYWVIALEEPSVEDMLKTVEIPTQMILYGIRD